MLKRCREKSAPGEQRSRRRARGPDDQNGAATWRRIADAVLRFANKALPGRWTDRFSLR
jgi:hypothetical protein